MGLRSANGLWTSGTHYHKRKLDRPRLRWTTFVPRRGALHLSKRFKLGDKHEWIRHSDHVPLVADFDIIDHGTPRGWLVSVGERLLALTRHNDSREPLRQLTQNRSEMME